MKFILILFLFIADIHASEKIVVACTSRCDQFFIRALNIAAKNISTSFELIDLTVTKTPLSSVDALIIPGGADINPEYYLNGVEEDLQEYTRNRLNLVKFTDEGRRRDPVEYKMLKTYFGNEDYKNLPVLGVCRGMQMLAVSQGIPLYLDIKTELGIRNRRYLFDKIHVDQGSSQTLMNQLFNHDFWGFKRHHQGIRVNYFTKHSDRWPDVKLTSFSNHGLIAESLEFKNRPVLGVQFHPENDFGHERKQIFTWLLKKAKNRMLQKSIRKLQ